MNFVHQRHKPPTPLRRPRELVVALPQMQSNVNLSRIVRAAGCCAIQRVVACGSAKVEAKIARDGAEQIEIAVHRSLPPVLKKYRSADYRLVGLEQATGSTSLPDYTFRRRTLLAIGHERQGLSPDVLELLEDVVEIPVYGLPFSHNVATAAAIAMYEYCRQFPHG